MPINGNMVMYIGPTETAEHRDRFRVTRDVEHPKLLFGGERDVGDEFELADFKRGGRVTIEFDDGSRHTVIQENLWRMYSGFEDGRPPCIERV